MKTIFYIFIVVFLWIISGCVPNARNPINVRDISVQHDENWCNYRCSNYLEFYDSCGKYNVGDTIKITKAR